MSRLAIVQSCKPDSKDNSFSDDIESGPEIQILSTLGCSKFLVVKSQVSLYQEPVAMKIFPYQDGKLHYAYQIESKFSKLQHQNIIKILSKEDHFASNFNGNSLSGSCIIMELALCDTVDIIDNADVSHNPKLVRTIFRDLIEGLSYLHAQGICHLDIKPENMLLGSDYRIKLADFDFSYDKTVRKINGRGTENYRSAEIRDRTCKNPYASDIYSLGIVLFILRTKIFPFLEGKMIKGFDLETLANDDVNGFVEAHKALGGIKDLDEDFVNLFTSMIKRNPSERISLNDIFRSKWMQGPTYTPEELRTLLN